MVEKIIKTRRNGIRQGYWVGKKPKKCDPRRYICSVDQWFKEKERLAKLPRIEAIEQAKVVFSEELWKKIEAAEYKQSKVRPYTYSDLIYLKDEIKDLEKKIDRCPWDRSLREELEKKKVKYRDILSVENRLFRKAVREKNVSAVIRGIYRRLPDRIIYSITSNVIGVVELYFKGLGIGEIHQTYPEMSKGDIREIIDVIKKYER